ncbi:CAP domain-containing protein [Selenihalanaerobacter shriftii]|uniref:Uncharacterized protein, YkwD family n=1 Tax=Selenihalanaerobacter shriftii TaxID=142842 RepID=A0A1T4N7D0_9FIRM|nr:CAP domain-containing protein [Selenihalanaerobacter shriftii]SJZ74996.1 uncharacterized protein, YkwD family [Selenihalanaerobacter shriftii]
MKGRRFIAALLIIFLLVPSFVGIFWTSNAYAFAGLDSLQLNNDGVYSILKGLGMLFLLNKLIDDDDDSSPVPSTGSNDNTNLNDQDSPTQQEPQPTTKTPQPTNNDSVDIVEEEPPTTDGSNTDWTEMQVNGLTVAEQKMLNLLNQERTKRGLQPLQADLELVKVARAKSQDMIENNYFAHQSPTYGSPFDMMQALNINYTFAGENIAGASTVEQAHQALMNSEGHRENILRPRFTHVGIGIIDGGPYGIMFSQEFIDVN